ncbi:MAG: NADH-quinone oxidoreductase subunit J [Bacteroidales bacterium]
MISIILFSILSFVAVFGALMVLLAKKPIHSVLYMTMTFFAIAGHYVLLNAQFLAIVHIIVYAGAIMVLFLFTVMLLNLNRSGQFQKSMIWRLVAGITGGLLFITLIGSLKSFEIASIADPSLTQVGTVKNLGKVLFSQYVLPFEFSSLLFLAAMVGAVMFGKKDKQ